MWVVEWVHYQRINILYNKEYIERKESFYKKKEYFYKANLTTQPTFVLSMVNLNSILAKIAI